MEEFPLDWSEFLSALKRHGVRFLLIGGHALAAHGRPRLTQDLDVLVEPTLVNARRVAAAIAEFGFAEIARDWRWFTKPYRITMLGRLPMRIDILTGISGVEFRVAWRNRMMTTMAIGDVAVIGLAEFRINKLASGRPKDLLDLALLDELGKAAPTRVASRSRSPHARPAARKSRARGTQPRRRKRHSA